MGCVVNGPGESRHANIGISLPGTGEEPKAPVYVDGRLAKTLKGEAIVSEFIEILNEYVESHYAQPSSTLPGYHRRSAFDGVRMRDRTGISNAGTDFRDRDESDIMLKTHNCGDLRETDIGRRVRWPDGCCGAATWGD